MLPATICCVFTTSETDRMASTSNAVDLSKEVAYWASRLRPDELEYANLYLNRSVNGYTAVQCYKLTHPNVTEKSAGRMATRMIGSYNVAGYIQAMMHESVSDSVMCLEELKEDLTIQIRGYDWLFDGYVTWENTPMGRIAFVDSLEDVPPRLAKYVTGHQYHAESEGYELYLRQYSGKESDKNKARQLLIQMQGGLIDKKEIEVTARGQVQQITDEMSDDDAATVYKNFMRGGK